MMNNINNILCSDDSNNLFPKYLGEFVANPFLPRCIEEGESLAQPGWNVPANWGFLGPYESNRRKIGYNLFQFDLANARCKSPKLVVRGFGGASYWDDILVLAWLLQKKYPYISREKLVSR